MDLMERTTDWNGALNRALGDVGLEDSPKRSCALESFQKAGFPTHKDEEWKYVSLRDFAERSWSPMTGDADAHFSAELLPALGIEGPRLVFVNGVFQPKQSQFEGVPGLTVLPLHGNEEPVGALASYEGKLGSTNDARFSALNDALWTRGALIRVDDGCALETPIATIWIVTDGVNDEFSMPRSLVEIGENAQAKWVEIYAGSSGAYWTNSVAEVRLDNAAVLEHVRLQIESDESLHLGTTWVDQAADSTYFSTSIQFGARIGRAETNVTLNGEHTETWLNGVYVGRNEQVLANLTRLDHAKPNCHSFEVYKGILEDQASGVFNGKIFVYQDAQKTDAKQTNQALLLSPHASINTKPQLEIFADDVKCTHGATVGQLREDAMFYLRSRGIPESAARNMLVYAFAAEVLERISVPSIREGLEALLFEKLDHTASKST